MASRITARFDHLRARSRAAFIPYITAGDPDLATTAAVMDALAAGGADIIELGVPFSDPVADGPVIQAAMTRALAHGTRLDDVLELVRGFRGRHPDVPVVLFGYLNPLYQRGLRQICAEAEAAGADGFLVVDLPPEEAAQLTTESRAKGLDFIALFTPTSDDDRVARIADQASGFAYYVSMGGVTGDALTDLAPVAERVARVRQIARLPVCVGFGIRTPEDATAVARFADGVIVGSALVAALEAAAPGAQADTARAMARAFRDAIDGARA